MQELKEEARSEAASRDQAVSSTSILSEVFVKKVYPHPTGFFLNCDLCGVPISHDDLLGVNHGTYFEIRGFHCPNCGHKSVKTYSKNRKTECVPFNWKSLNLPSARGRC